jgi:hypothetical protein
MTLTANDGAVITVHNAHDPNAGPDEYGWVVDCSVCMNGGSGGTKANAEEDASYHLEWHNDHM